MKSSTKILTVFFLLSFSYCLYADFPIRKSINPDKDIAVAYNSQNDEYLVVWEEWGSTTGTTALPVMGQRVKGDGSGLIGGAFEVLPGGAYPAVAYNSQINEYFVTASFMGSIVGRGVTNTGAVKNNFSVLMGSGSNAIWSRIIYNSLGNNYLLVGAELIHVGNGLSNIKISTRIIAANGQATGSEHLVYEQWHGAYADGARFSVAYAPIQSSETPQGRYLLVIDTPADLKMLDSNGEVMLTTYNPQSQQYYYSVPFQQSKIGVAYNVDVAFGYWNGDPIFFIVWGDRKNSWVNYPDWSGIIGGIVDANKIQYLTTEGVSNETMPISWIYEHYNTPDHVKSWRPKVAYNSSSQKFMVVWRETANTNQSNDTKVTHIRANLIDSYQIPAPANTVISATTGNEDPMRPAIAVSSASAQALVVWEDKRNFSSTDVDVYGNLFKTTSSEKLEIIEPNGGEKWYVGSQQEVWWQSTNFTGPVKIEYSTNGGTSWKTISSSTTNKNFPWTIPNDPSTNCLVRVSDAADGNPSDVSDAPFSILAAKLTIIAPNGGEKWQVASTQNIQWSSQNIPNNDVSIEYSTNNGQTFTSIGVKTNNSATESWQWSPIPNTPSKNCRVRISVYMQNVLISDVSDAVFEISSPTQSISVTSPNGGEKWLVASNHNITWTNQNFSSAVKIDYSINNGSSYLPVTSSTTNSGSYSWTVPNTPSSQCLVKVSDAGDGNPADVSNAVFEIAVPDNTQTGTNITVDLGNGIKLTFDNVSSSGSTTVTTSSSGTPPPNGFAIIPQANPIFYDINTTAGYSGNIKICIQYDDTGMTPAQEKSLKFYVYEQPPGQWKDITLSLDTNANIICGQVNHLTEFAIMMPTTGAIIKFVPSVSNLRVGHPDTIDVVIDSVNDLGSFEFEIAYDGTIIQIAQSSDVLPGSFLGTTGRTAIPIGPTIDNSAGKVVYASASLGTQAGASGSGVLAKIIWTPLSEGTSMLNLKNVKVSDTQGVQIPAVDEDGQINVTDRFWADVDGDNDIDIIDVQLVAAHWNTHSGDANYDPLYDVDNNGEGDGDVDIIDVQLVASWWNKAIPPNSLLGFYNEQGINLEKMSEQRNVSLRIFPENFTTSGKQSLIIQAENAVDVAGFQFDLVLDNSQVAMPEISLGDFLVSSGNKISTLGPLSNNSGNKLTFGAFSLGKNKGAEGTGVLARIQLEKGMDFADGLNFENFSLVDSRGRQLKISAVNNEYTDLQNQSQLPNGFSLSQNYPNPFNPETYISFELADGQKDQIHVGLFIYNVQGQLVRKLVNESKSPGVYTIKWNVKNDFGENVPSGIYVYALTVGEFKTSRKMLLLK